MTSAKSYPFDIGSCTQHRWSVSETEVDLTAGTQRPVHIALDAEPKRVIFDASRSALVVIDMQNNFCASGGRVDAQGGDAAKLRTPIAPINAVLPAFRSWGADVIWVNWGLRPDLGNTFPTQFNGFKKEPGAIGLGETYSETSGRSLVEASWDASITEGLNVDARDTQVSKYRVSAFWDTPLDSILRNRRIDTLFFAGVNMDQCVLHSLVDAHCLGYACVLLADCSATTSPECCVESTLYNVRRCFGFVAQSADLVKAGIRATAG